MSPYTFPRKKSLAAKQVQMKTNYVPLEKECVYIALKLKESAAIHGRR